MRGALLAAALVALATMTSGCVRLVSDDGTETTLGTDEQVAEAQKVLDEQKAARYGDIVGTALEDGSDYVARMAGVVVSITDIGQVKTDEKGVFAFRQLVPQTYTLTAVAPGFLEWQTQVDVKAGQVVTLEVRLVPEPPIPYFTVLSYEAYIEAALYPNADNIVFGCNGCLQGQTFDGPDAELSELVVEAVLNGATMASDAFRYDLDTYGWGGDYFEAGSLEGPLYLRIPGSDIGPADGIDVHVEPDASALSPTLQASFTVYVTMFYNGAGPADYSALA